MHTSPDGTRTPQDPQLDGSMSRFTQVSEHTDWPGGHCSVGDPTDTDVPRSNGDATGPAVTGVELEVGADVAAFGRPPFTLQLLLLVRRRRRRVRGGQQFGGRQAGTGGQGRPPPRRSRVGTHPRVGPPPGPPGRTRSSARPPPFLPWLRREGTTRYFAPVAQKCPGHGGEMPWSPWTTTTMAPGATGVTGVTGGPEPRRRSPRGRWFPSR